LPFFQSQPREVATLLNQSVHRKPPTLVGVPSLTRHLIFWDIQQENYGNSDRRTIYIRQDKKTIIDHYLKSLYDNLLRHGYNVDLPLSYDRTSLPLFGVILDRNTGQTVADNDIDNEVVVFSFNWAHMVPVTMRFEFHEEYITISIVMDLSIEFLSLNGINRKGLRLVKFITDVFERLNLSCNFNIENNSQYRKLHRHIYNNIWALFDINIFSFYFYHVVGLTRVVGHECCGKKIGDLRRVVIGSCAYPTEDVGRVNKYIEGRAFQLTFSQPPIGAGALRTYSTSSKKASEWAYSRLEMIWKFVLSADRMDGHKRREITASRLLDGLVLYVTALGPRPASSNPASDANVPMYSIMYSDTLNPWQIGELSERLNRLGTVRLAATMDFDKLRCAGNLIRDIRRGILQYIVKYQNSSSAKIEAITALGNEYIYTEKCIAGITDEVDIGVGIEARIERSYDYIKQWRGGLNELRIRRLEGFFPYDEFIERRLGSTFNYIEKLRGRYKRLMANVVQFHSYYIAKLQAVIAENTESREKEIEHLQKGAEFLTIAFLIPYYLASTITHSILKDEHNEGRLQEVPLKVDVTADHAGPPAYGLPFFANNQAYKNTVTGQAQTPYFESTSQEIDEHKWHDQQRKPLEGEKLDVSLTTGLWSRIVACWHLVSDWFTERSANQNIWFGSFVVGVAVAIINARRKRSAK